MLEAQVQQAINNAYAPAWVYSTPEWEEPEWEVCRAGLEELSKELDEQGN
jgi:hypothetical protein